MKKRLISLVLAILMIFSVIAMTVYATDIGDTSDGSTAGYGSTRTEEVKWYYRTYNGVKQMRLWSLTYARWITDWIDC